jgi:hypothetical protein
MLFISGSAALAAEANESKLSLIEMEVDMRYVLATLILLWQIVTPYQVNSAGAPVKVSVGYAALNPRVLPLWIAYEQGMFTKYGIDAEPIFIRVTSLWAAAAAAPRWRLWQPVTISNWWQLSPAGTPMTWWFVPT